ncbi:MAG: arylsulfatase [Planctomycetaceae bacterium]|nr:arylsulfatase [Planctomycetaceae bacterium]
MSRVFQLLLSVILIIVSVDAVCVSAQRPNVVIVITDDQGYGDLSCIGNPVLKTPHIDDLYEESVRLTDYHVSPTCSPTRSAFLTGHWTNRTGVWHTIMGRSMLREDEVTMGQIFKDAGYATGMFGKWHLGDNYPYRPEDRGYTEVLRHGGGGVGQTPDFWDNSYFDGSYWHNGTPTPVKGFCTDVFFDYAKRFIKAQKEAGKPFLVHISPNAPHGPMHSPEKWSKPYKEQGVQVANFFGMIANIDHNVGQLREFLKQEDLDQNTIFIFTTDNGTSSGSRVFNAGMRGAKGSEYDGGHRVPFFIHWPEGKMTKPVDVPPITAHVDVLPTLMDYCQITKPKNLKFDGRSIRPLLDQHQRKSGKQKPWPDRILVTDSQRVKDPIKWRKSSVMTSRWRLINGKELYDIKQDPGQKSNIASGNPQVVQRLSKFYDAWWADLEPSFANSTAIYLGDPHENPTRLTSHDWITTRLTPWNQAHVRSAYNGDENTGFWNVKVVEDGDYEIRLRRWPEEVNRPINASLPPGKAVPGAKAYRTTPGKAINAVRATLQIGDTIKSKHVSRDAIEIVYELRLKAGTTTMKALFLTEQNEEFGAYFVYVTKK